MVDYNISLIPYKVINAPKVVDIIPDGVKLIQAPQFWERGHKGEGVVIAIIDTGCDITHPDLSDRILGVRNFTEDDGGNPDIVKDIVGHGTHVAGIIAANENGTGIIGVAPKAKLLILKALSKSSGSYKNVTAAINYAVLQKVNIISISLGGHVYDENMANAIKNAIKNNILVVCAAGNAGDGNGVTDEISYPAAINEVISVGSVDTQKHISRFSSSNKEIDLVAPGQGLNGRGIYSTAPNGGYVELQGTSMACPHVAGALALIINWVKDQFKRDFSEAELYAQLIKKTVSLGYDKTIEGNGLLYLTADDILSQAISNYNLY